VFDAIFSEPARCGEKEDEALAAAVARAGNVVLGFYLTQIEPRGGAAPLLPSPVEVAVVPPGGFPEVPVYRGIETNIPVLGQASTLGGHFVIQPDSDGTVRHYPMVLAYGGQLYPSLALRAVQVFLGKPPISVRPYEGNLPLARLGDLEIPTSEKGELWINFRGRFGRTFPYYPIADVLSGAVPADSFRNRLVFVGATETGIGDIRTSPFDTTVPGVEVHATVADNLLRGRFIRDGAPETILGILAVLVLGPICGAAAGLTRRPALGAIVTGAALLLYVVAAQGAFTSLSRHVYLFVPIVAGLLGYTAGAVWRNVFSEAKARQIRRTFQQYVSHSIVEEMLQDPDRVRLGGEKRDLTVLFSDIRGFTSLSEKLSPEQVVSLLNEYLTPMTRIILNNGGTLDKYMGDAIMAFFGAPVAQDDHPRRAVLAAIRMREELVSLNREWARRGLPAVHSGIGINTGAMAVGNMGSTMIFDYTVIGDHVNLGSRLEGLTKTYGVEIVVSEHTEARVRDSFRLREIDRVRVKGKDEPVRIFELMGAAEDPAAVPGFLDAFAAGIAAYREGRLDRARERFGAARAARPDDPPTLLYLARLEHLRESPPTGDWDGVTDFAEK
jgi:adenylate cyclase